MYSSASFVALDCKGTGFDAVKIILFTSKFGPNEFFFPKNLKI
jgi:hypothetical protein